MLEKLSILSIKTNQKLNVFELELFIELLNNQIHWDQILEIMRLQNDDKFILRRIDKNAICINDISQNHIPKIHRFDWIIKRVLQKKWLIDILKKSFMYPIFLWLISLNLMTFLVMYILPSTLNTFNSFANTSQTLNSIMIFVQFIIGLEWGILIINIGLFYSIKIRNINYLYKKLYIKTKRNLLVNILSFIYLFDLLYLLNLDLNIESIMNILKMIEYPMYFEISERVQSNLKQGQSIKFSFDYLDLTFLKLLTIDDFERKMNDRINQHLNILKKQIEIGIKKYAMIYISFVYIQIGMMVLMVYSVLLYPLKLLEGMNL